MARLPDAFLKRGDGTIRTRKFTRDEAQARYLADSVWTTRDEAAERAAALRAKGYRVRTVRDRRPLRTIPGAKPGERRLWRSGARDMWGVYIRQEAIACRN